MVSLLYILFFNFFFQGHLLPHVLKSKAWGILHTLAEMFSYRLHHIQSNYRVYLLTNLYPLIVVPFTGKHQLYLWYEIIKIFVYNQL